MTRPGSVGRTRVCDAFFKGSVWLRRRRNMLRWCLPKTSTRDDVRRLYFVVTGSVTPAFCCFSSSPNFRQNRFSLLFRHYCLEGWSLSTSGTLLAAPSLHSAVPVVFLAKSTERTHTRGRAHTHRHNALLWLAVARRKIFFATVPGEKGQRNKRKENLTNAFRKCPHYARRRSF